MSKALNVAVIGCGYWGPISVHSLRLNLGLIQRSINVTWDLAPHDLSILLHVLNQTPVAVNCQGKAHYRAGIEEVSSLNVEFSGGCFATIQSSWLHPTKIRTMTFVGSKKMLLFDDLDVSEKIRVYDKYVAFTPASKGEGEMRCAYHQGEVHVPHLGETEPLRRECQHFLTCIQNAEQPISGGREGMEVVQILEAAQRSIQNGGARIAIETTES